MKLKNLANVLCSAIACTVLAACHTTDPLASLTQRFTPYRMMVVQGNFVSREAAAKVRMGMSREAVRNILGTPLLVDPFHPNRWDYVFYFKRGETEVMTQRHFMVRFDKEQVVEYSSAEQLPSEKDLIKAVDGTRNS